MPIMPVTPGGPPQQQPVQNADIEKLRAALPAAIMQLLNAPQPQAPQYQPTPLTNVQGFALARNPQAAAQMMQYQQAPAQARYAQQQAAFEGAMAGRKEALAAGTSLLNADEARQVRLAIAEMKAAPRSRTRLVYDPKGNAYEQDLDTHEVRPIPLPGGGQAGKPLTEAERASGESISVLQQELARFKEGAIQYAGKERILGTARATTQQFVRGLGETGQSLSESYGDPQFEALASARTRIGKMLARLVENNRLSDYDVIWAMQQLPTVASLNTPEGRLQFSTKIDQVERELMKRIEMRAQLGRTAGTPAVPKSGPSDAVKEWMQKRGHTVKP